MLSLGLGQECWQLIAQWVWNLRLELGHQLHPDPVRTTEFASALSLPPPYTAPGSGYAPPEVGSAWKAGRFAGQGFALQSDGTLRYPADQKLTSHEQRREADGSLRVVYGASIQLSSLSAARAVLVAGQHHQEATPGQHAVTPTGCRF